MRKTHSYRVIDKAFRDDILFILKEDGAMRARDVTRRLCTSYPDLRPQFVTARLHELCVEGKVRRFAELEPWGTAVVKFEKI